MSIPSLEYLVGILLISSVFFILPTHGARRGLLSLCTFGFLASVIPNPASWAALAAFLLSGYAVARALASTPRASLFALYIALLLGSFLVLKRYDFLELVLPASALRHPVAIVGLSYMLFRQIHFIVDSMQGQLKQTSIWGYLNYQLNLFTLQAGPIQRYQSFQSFWNTPVPLLRDRAEMFRAYGRLFWGVVQITLLAGSVFSMYESAVKGRDWGPVARGLAVFYGYPAFVYFNFVGYCNVVIGSAALLGLRLPENFDQPYLARNMIDFWNRWHITLGRWLRDYLFTPLYKLVAMRWPARAQAAAPVCYFIVFVLAGMWHGSTLNFVVFGLLHGAGVYAAKLWETRILARGGRKALKQYMASGRVRIVATVATFHFACATFLFFPADLPRCLEIVTAVLSGEAVL